MIVQILVLMLFCNMVRAETYKIGVLAPLSGSSAEKGVSIRNAAQLFIDNYNKANKDKDIHIELMVRDDFDDPQKARTAAEEMVTDKSLLAVIGHYHASPALATAKVFNEAGLPFLVNYSKIIRQPLWSMPRKKIRGHTWQSIPRKSSKRIMF
jgi:ABC-type branched-subunit amino acid transport system substrate-binding protein